MFTRFIVKIGRFHESTRRDSLMQAENTDMMPRRNEGPKTVGFEKEGWIMRVGVPKEVKSDEYRVAMMPVGVELLTKAGHEVMVETNAGVSSGFADEDY